MVLFDAAQVDETVSAFHDIKWTNRFVASEADDNLVRVGWHDAGKFGDRHQCFLSGTIHMLPNAITQTGKHCAKRRYCGVDASLKTSLLAIRLKRRQIFTASHTG